MRIFILAGFLVGMLAIIGCRPHTEETTSEFILPEGMKDCRIYTLSNGVHNIEIVRCPNSTTSSSYMQGKVRQQTVTVDGVEYIRR